jgi:hypothetical protein
LPPETAAADRANAAKEDRGRFENAWVANAHSTAIGRALNQGMTE